LLTLFVFAPVQAVGVFLFQAFGIAALLAIIYSMMIISDSRVALALMSVSLRTLTVTSPAFIRFSKR
jgi:hypothetical protein